MALPPFEAKAWMEKFGPEMANTPAPFFGVNILDINKENLEACLAAAVPVNEWALKTDGFKPNVHYSMRDYGDRVRILVINHFDKPVDLEAYQEHTHNHQRFQDEWMALCTKIDAYSWFTTTELAMGE